MSSFSFKVEGTGADPSVAAATVEEEFFGKSWERWKSEKRLCDAINL
jgi:hypothetical protein